MVRLFACALLLSVSVAYSVEIATGPMLGARYDQRSFYTREGRGPWRKTYSGSAFRPSAAGKLMNLRIAQALFHDEWLTEAQFDPDAHTERVIRALDAYKAHGILAISVSLQGGNMAYHRNAGDTIKRERSYKLGPEKGAYVSAYRPDGSLKPEWLKRCLRLARELNKRRMVLNLMYLYAHQDEQFESPDAIGRAIVATTDWLIDNDVRNVIIEIANEYDIEAWDHDKYVPQNVAKLIQLARSRFEAKKAKFRLPVTASVTGLRALPETGNADIAAVHGNGISANQKRSGARKLFVDPAVRGPIYMNEDDNGRETTLANLAEETWSCEALYQSGGSWGYMPWVQLQIWPFRNVEPGARSHISDDMPVEERDAAYFKAVLEHVRDLVFTAR